MDINEIFKKTDTNVSTMLSEIIETQCLIKSMLRVVISELAYGNKNKEEEIISSINKLNVEELLRVVARFSAND